MYPNVHYEFSRLEQLITAAKKQSVHPDLFSDDGNLNAALSTMQQEFLIIKQKLTSEVVSFPDEQHLQRYIHHQQQLIRLLDDIQKEMPAHSGGHYKAHNAMNEGLQDLLSFIEHHFSHYFDLDAKAPHIYIEISAAQAKPAVEGIRNKLILRNADAALVEVMLQAPGELLHKQAITSLSYRHVLYAREMLQQLTALLEDEVNTPINEHLRFLALLLNHNSVRSINWHTHYFSKLIESQDTHAGKIEQSSAVLKAIHQVPVKARIGYDLRASSLVDQLDRYLSEELQHLQRIQSLQDKTPPLKDGPAFPFRLVLEMSVAQLSFLIRVMTETKIIRNDNVSDLLRFFTRFSVTKKAERISYDSLRAKYYNAEQGARLSVRNLLSNMLRYIDQNT